MQSDPPSPDEDDALLIALGAVYREREAETAAAWPAAEHPFKPIEGDEADAMFDRVRARTGAATEAPQGAKIIAFPTRRVFAATLAIAAGLLLFVFSRGPSGPDQLPSYELTALTGDQALRNDGPHSKAKRAEYTPGSRVLLVARPSASIQRPVTARIYLRQAGEDLAVDAPVKVSATGAVRVDLVAGASLPMKAGEGEVILLLLPAGVDEEGLLEAADPSPARRLRHPFRYRP